jgi:hypothetical protein
MHYIATLLVAVGHDYHALYDMRKATECGSVQAE